MALRAATPTVGTGASQTAGTPGATTSSGEYLGLWIVTDDFSKTPTPSGFTQRADASVSLPDGQSAMFFDKIATGSEGTGVAVTNLATGNAVMIMFALTGRNTSAPRTFTPHVATSTANNASVITISDTVTGTGVAGDDQVWVVMVDTRGVAGWVFGNSLAGWTRQVNQDDTWTPAGLYSRDNVSAGAIGTLSTTATNAGNTGGWGAVVLSIAAAAAATGTFVDDSSHRTVRRVYSAALRASGVNPLTGVLATPEVPQADAGSRGWRAPPLRERGADALPSAAAQQATSAASGDSPLPERYPALRVFGADALAGVLQTPEVPQADQAIFGRGSYPSARALGFEPLAAVLATPELPRADAPFRGWQPGPNRERGAETAPPLVATAPVPSAAPALRGWSVPLNRAAGAETQPPLVGFQPVPNADPALTGWRVPLNRAFGAETPPAMLQVAPLPSADQAFRGWQPGPNRERGAEVAPPLAATQPVPNADLPLRGWRPPLNRATGTETPPPVVFTSPTEAKPAEYGWRRVANRDRGVDGLPTASSLPSFPDVPAVWEFTRQAPPLRLRDGFAPLASVRATPPVGDVSPAWRQAPRFYPWLLGFDPLPPVVTTNFAPVGFVSDAPQQAPRPTRASAELGADAAPPVFYQPLPFVSPTPDRQAKTRAPTSADPLPGRAAIVVPLNDAWVPRARAAPYAQAQAFPASVTAWGYEPSAPPRRAPARSPEPQSPNPRGAIGPGPTLLPWIWEQNPYPPRSPRFFYNSSTIGLSRLLVPFAVASSAGRRFGSVILTQDKREFSELDLRSGGRVVAFENLDSSVRWFHVVVIKS
jgi:hypothetical protein